MGEASTHVNNESRRRHIVWVGVSGVALLILGQTLTLVHLRPVSEYWYGIVWTGFILTVDAFLAWRTGASFLLDRRRDFVVATLLSASGWWLFELANVLLLDSWSYSPSPDVPRWIQALRSTYFFATLVPATFEASLLALYVAHVVVHVKPARPLLEASARKRLALVAIIAGATTAVLALAYPIVSLPLVLIAAGLVVDALNLLRDRPSLLAHLRTGAWSLPLAIGLGNMAAGVVGEMWNYPAAPKWSYRVPYADTVRLFEMPLPGYLGYAALAFDLFAFVHLVRPANPSSPASPASPALPKDHPLVSAGLS